MEGAASFGGCTSAANVSTMSTNGAFSLDEARQNTCIRITAGQSMFRHNRPCLLRTRNHAATTSFVLCWQHTSDSKLLQSVNTCKAVVLVTAAYLLFSSEASLAARRIMRSFLVPMGNQHEATPDRLAASISLLISSRPLLRAHCLSS